MLGLTLKVCPECKQEFVQARADQVYHNRTCKQRAHDKRKTEVNRQIVRRFYDNRLPKLLLWWAWNKETGKRQSISHFDVPPLDVERWHIEQVWKYRLVYAMKYDMRTIWLTQSVAERVQQRGVGKWIIKRML